mmetsp:Transcript_113326/g.206152  ORF Transcript_113326/g.206152 Transcript_113326/m.206152 type:complete len:104 (-) Transcript_113326:353-664(-)
MLKMYITSGDDMKLQILIKRIHTTFSRWELGSGGIVFPQWWQWWRWWCWYCRGVLAEGSRAGDQMCLTRNSQVLAGCPLQGPLSVQVEGQTAGRYTSGAHLSP